MKVLLFSCLLLSSISSIHARTINILDCALSNSRLCPFVGQNSTDVGKVIKVNAIEDAARNGQRQFKIDQPYYYEQKKAGTCEEISNDFAKLGVAALSEQEMASCKCVKEAPAGNEFKAALKEYRMYVDIQASLVYRKWKTFLLHRDSLGTNTEQELKLQLEELENEIQNGLNIKFLNESRSRVESAFDLERERLNSICK